MKKMFFLAATAALALSSCSSDELAQAPEVNGAEDGAVSFSAYVGRDTRAALLTETEISGQGFGVYAYEQGTTPWDSYRTGSTYPNFMYNQKVACKVATWALPASITNEQYTALGTGASTYFEETDGAHTRKSGMDAIADGTFQGYPEAVKALGTPTSYTASTWDYTPHKYFSNNEGALHSFFAYAPYNESADVVFSKLYNGPVIRYNATEDYDLLYANAFVDQKKQTTAAKFQFNFQHALSAVFFDVAYFNDNEHNASHTTTDDKNLLDANTTITVRSIKFVGTVPSKGLCNLNDGSWVIEETEEGAYGINPQDLKFVGGTDDANVTKNAMNAYKTVIPTTLSNGTVILDNGVKIQVVYDVVTVDPANPKNNSTITNTITSKESFQLVQGTTNLFHLHLGMTSVKFDAEVTGWAAAPNTTVDLPNNKN